MHFKLLNGMVMGHFHNLNELVTMNLRY